VRCFLRVLFSFLLFISMSRAGSAQVVSIDPNYSVSSFATGLTTPDSIFYRPTTNDFLVLEFTLGKIVKIDSNGSVTNFASAPPGTPSTRGGVLSQAAMNSKGELFVAAYAVGGPILEFDSTGKYLSQFLVPNFPAGIAFDAADNFYVSSGPNDNTADTIYQYTAASGYTTSSVFASGFAGAIALTFNAAGQLFAADFMAGNVYQVEPGGTTASSHVLWASGLVRPVCLAIDPIDQSVFVGDYDTDKISRITAPGVFSDFASGSYRTDALAFDSLGDLFASQGEVGTVWKFTRLAVAPLQISPDHGGNTGTVTVHISGQGLEAGATVSLKGSGPDIAGMNTSLLYPGIMGTTFDLTNATPDTRDVVVSNPDGTTLSLPNVFTIEAGGTPQVGVQILGMNKIRFDRPQTYYLEITNNGSIDSPPGLASLEIPPSVGFVQFSGPDLVMAGSSNLELFQVPSTQPTSDNVLLFATAGVPAHSAQIAAVQLTLPSATGLSAASRRRLLARSNSTTIAPPSGFVATIAWLQSLSNMTLDQWLALKGVAFVAYDPSCPQCINAYASEVAAFGVLTNDYVTLQNNLAALYDAWVLLPADLAKVTAAELAAFYLIEYAVQAGLIEEGIITTFSGLGIANLVDNVLSCVETSLQANSRQQCLSNFALNLQTTLESLIALGQGILARDTGLLATSIVMALDYLEGSIATVLTGISDLESVFDASGNAQLAYGNLQRDLAPFATAQGQYLACLNANQVNPPPPPPVVPPGTNNLPINGVTSLDPNSEIGPQGYGPQDYITGNTPLVYADFFSNEISATAAAQTVTVTSQLDVANDDMSTFSFGPISFLDRMLLPTAFQPTFSSTVDLRPSMNLLIAVNATLNVPTGAAKWTFTSLDPATKLPPQDPTAGFLPPGAGGSVQFSVSTKPGLTTNTQTANQSIVTFDTNSPIPTANWINLFDKTSPVSHVLALPAATWSTNIPVNWAGTDVGSGIGSYTVSVSDNGAAYAVWQANTTAASGIYSGLVGHNYGFYSIATDNVGNVEPSKTAAEASTTIALDTTPPVITPSVSGTLGKNGWYTSGVNVFWSVTDPESGIASSTGCSTVTLSSNTAGTTITCSATNGGGLSGSASVTINIDQTAPVISGMPPMGCELWAPDRKLVRAAKVSAADVLSGLASFNVSGTSNEPGDPNDVDDIKIEGRGLQPRTIYLRAEKLGLKDDDWKRSGRHENDDRRHFTPKVYTLTATATDQAGNNATATSTCTVENKRGGDWDR
jgi:hypothetical protein